MRESCREDARLASVAFGVFEGKAIDMRALIERRRLLGSLVIVSGVVGAATGARANLDIIPIFRGALGGNTTVDTKAQSAIELAINTIDGLYSNNLTIGVTFAYSPLKGNALLETSEYLYPTSYAAYTGQLKADFIANPSNTTLATAVANLSKGNDAKGADKVAISGALGAALGMMATGNSDATITINNSANFALSGTVLSAQYDLIGGTRARTRRSPWRRRGRLNSEL